MSDFVNPRGRIFQFPILSSKDLNEVSLETIGIGLAKFKHLKAFFRSAEKAASVQAENPALEVLHDGILVARCELNVGAAMLSEMDILEEDGVDELQYAVEFKDIRVLRKYQKRGIGRRLTACAARHASSMIIEDLYLRQASKATVSFHATLVSDQGELLYGELMEAVTFQLQHFEDNFEIDFVDEGGR